MKRACRGLLLCGAAMSAWVIPASANIYDAAGGFLPTNNPGQIWNYGLAPTLGAPIQLFTNYTTNWAGFSNFIAWYGNDFPGSAGPNSGFPEVMMNGTGSPFTGANLGNWLPSELLLHPDSHDDLAVVQFTAPSADIYTITGAFVGIDNLLTTSTNGYITINGNNVFSGNVPTWNVSQAFSITSQLAAGDTVDFAVSWGPPRNVFQGDSTGLIAVITTPPDTPPSIALPPPGPPGPAGPPPPPSPGDTPEPGFYGLTALGLGIMVFIRRRSLSKNG
ncbi:MAG TPA: PEP-CTERM sorting domain-containing protein [Terriglobales bacterium]|nr:PEP-CTERM sorting domain-containing protein [Terriglobales bacterium]